jgi:hypothetical protein
MERLLRHRARLHFVDVALPKKPFCDGSHVKIDFKAPADLG